MACRSAHSNGVLLPPLRLLFLCVAIALVPLLAVDAQQRALDAAQLLARTPTPAMHVTLGEPVMVDVRLQIDINAPRLEANRWQFVVAGPATVPGQRVLANGLVPAGKKSQDRSLWRRPLLIGELAAGKQQQHQATSIWSMRLELRSRTLQDGVGAEAVPALSATERAAGLANNAISDWTSEDFQRGLDNADLRPHAGEHTVAFARRVLRQVRSLRYAFTDNMERNAAAVLAAGASDCGGLGGLTVATLRAAGIPARLLVGRWAKNADPADTLEGLPYRQWHVKLEFHLDGIGWIPADASVGMTDPAAWFGIQNADFIIMHVDPVVKVDTLFGERELLWAQNIAFWVKGGGDFEQMVVDEQWIVTPVK